MPDPCFTLWPPLGHSRVVIFLKTVFYHGIPCLSNQIYLGGEHGQFELFMSYHFFYSIAGKNKDSGNRRLGLKPSFALDQCVISSKFLNPSGSRSPRL